MRQGIGVIILNEKNKVFVGKRKDNPIDKWQMPQGGIDENETPEIAMMRELAEETSIKTVKLIRELDEDRPFLLGDQSNLDLSDF